MKNLIFIFSTCLQLFLIVNICSGQSSENLSTDEYIDRVAEQYQADKEQSKPDIDRPDIDRPDIEKDKNEEDCKDFVVGASTIAGGKIGGAPGAAVGLVIGIAAKDEICEYPDYQPTVKKDALKGEDAYEKAKQEQDREYHKRRTIKGKIKNCTATISKKKKYKGTPNF